MRIAAERAVLREERTEIVMKVKSPSLFFNSVVRMMALTADLVTREESALQKRSLATSKAALLVLLALLAGAKVSSAQATGDIGLPVIFIHGICDTPDSFLNAETAIQNKLQNAYPNQYPLTPALHTRYVAYYNGSSVEFQVPVPDIHNGEGNLPVTTVEPSTKFFMVALDDPNGWLYQLFDRSVVASLPIYMKGNELANIIWRIKDITQAPRVIVVAHSMGGLDTRSYIEGLASPTGDTQATIPYQNDIASLVTLDTPHEGSDAAAWSVTFGGCSNNPSTDKSEMSVDILNGDPSPVMSQLEGSLLPPTGLSITSIASFWYNSNDIIPMPDQGTDDVLSEETQELTTIQNINSPGLTSVNVVKNRFTSPFQEMDSTGQASGNQCTNLSSVFSLSPIPLNVAQLHLLGCTGSQPQTFSLLESAIAPSLFMNQSTVQVSPDTTAISPGATATFSVTNGVGAIWSILEGADGGSINHSGVYTPPANISGATETFHIIAIDSQDLYHYGEATVQVGKTPTVLWVPSAASLTYGTPLGTGVLDATASLNGSTVSGTFAYTSTKTGGTPQTVTQATVLGAGTYTLTATFTPTDTTDYTTATKTVQLTVNKAVLTVTATNASVAYNQAIPALTYSVAGYVNGDTSSVLSGAPVETTTATKGSAAGTYPITITQGPLAATNYSFQFKNGTLTITTQATTATPTFSPVAGTYHSAQSVTIADATPGTTIYYTTNGTTPTTASTKYNGAISVTATETLEAIAVLSGYTNSAVASAKYTLVAATPTFSPVAGTYHSAQSVTIADATPGTTIYYTTNGTTPTTASTKYNGAISVTATETLEAIAVASSFSNSAVTTTKYTIGNDMFNGTGGTGTTFIGGSQANEGVNDENNSINPPPDRYATTWTQCNSGNNYCGTSSTAASAEDTATGLVWSYPCVNQGCQFATAPHEITTTGVTTTFSNELVVAAAGTGGWLTPATSTAGTGFTLNLSPGSISSMKQTGEYMLVSSIGYYSGWMTLSTWSVFAEVFATFKASGSAALVQVASTTSFTTKCVTTLNNVHAGDLLVFTERNTLSNSGANTVSVADNAGDTWSSAASSTYTRQVAEAIFYAPNAIGGTTTVTGTLNAAASNSCILTEYSGIATSSPLDVTSSLTGIGAAMSDYSWNSSGSLNNGLTASQLCASHTGWYLPHHKQYMESYIDGSFGNVADVAGGINWWSATTDARAPGYAWLPDLASGDQPPVAKGNLEPIRCVFPETGTLPRNLYEGTGSGSDAGFIGGSQANGGVDDYNNGSTPPANRYATTWMQCNFGNNYCGTGSSGANVEDTATGLVWSYPCYGLGCSSFSSTAFTSSSANSYTWDNSGAENAGASSTQLCSNHTGWYLPGQKELMQAYVDGSYGNLVPQGSNNYYWSGTRDYRPLIVGKVYPPEYTPLSTGGSNNASATSTENVMCVW